MKHIFMLCKNLGPQIFGMMG